MIPAGAHRHSATRRLPFVTGTQFNEDRPPNLPEGGTVLTTLDLGSPLPRPSTTPTGVSRAGGATTRRPLSSKG